MAAKDIEAHQFKKGQSGNPKGRPKKPDIDQYLIDALNDERNGITAIEAIIKTLIAKAVKGDVRAAQELLDRLYGKSSQRITHAGDTNDPVVINIHGNI